MVFNSKVASNGIAEAVKAGLTAERKYLPSWLFYDEKGDELFRQIMQMPEYYLTRCEAEILNTYSDAIAYNLRQMSKTWDIVELGAGDGTKTITMLKSFNRNNVSFVFHPVDVSRNALDVLQGNITKAMNSVDIRPVHAHYLEGLRQMDASGNRPKLILFMGANIGNFEISDATVFLRSVSSSMRSGDRMIIGFDLMKSPSVIEKAYHDYTGVTTLFNKNLLTRINRELNADFDNEAFEHWPIYDAVTGSCRSYLVSLKQQTVNIRGLKLTVSFQPWETIFTEVSQKYSENMIKDLVRQSNLAIEKMLFDSKHYFTLVILRSI